MTIEELKEKNCIIFECISGSQAYGLATETSDTDIKGVFILPRDKFYSLEYIEQVNGDNNNRMYYELRKFIELLAKNNPNMLEMLNVPADCVLYKHPLYDMLHASDFLSKLCKDSFAGYAMTQIKKARGLNKKILNPMDEKRKSILDFCYVVQGQGSVPLSRFLDKHNMKQDSCGLVVIPHMRDVYGLYYSDQHIYNGIARSKHSLDVTLSPVKEGEQPVGVMSFNKDGYSKYCKDYKEYHNWVKNRNEARYENTISHGKNYDAKNMMHTFRLLNMAEEIGRTGQVNVRRTDREFLLSIKRGEFEYEGLVQEAENKLKEIEEVYRTSQLPEIPGVKKIDALLVRIRESFYNKY